MDTSKVIRGVVNSGRYTVTAPIVKEDHGLKLKIEGVELPSTYQVDFSNNENSGSSVTMIGNADGVLIPAQFIKSGKDVFAFLYHVGEDYGRTVYKFRIPNKLRPGRTSETPTPEEQSVIDQAINALNEAVEQTARDVISADQSARSAKGYAEQAEDARDNAQTYANNASASATSASQSATASANSATASAQSAEQSAINSADAQDSAEDAQGYAQASAQSATASANSASQAQGFAQSASASAQSASGYASNAQTSAQTASAKAQDASTSAQTASQKATESAQSASQALGYKTDAESAKTASQTAQTASESARDSAVSAKTGAESARDDAESARDEAQQAVASIADALAEKAPVITDTASGSIASFSDGADDLPLKSLVVDINPIQDLNGQDAPYPAGSTANQLDLIAATCARCTLVDVYTGSVRVNITNAYFAAIVFEANVMPTAMMERILNGEPITFELDNNNGYSISIVVYGTRSNGSSYQEINGYNNFVTIKPTLFTAVTSIEFRFRRTGTQYTDTTKVMTGLRVSYGDTATTFQPYSNICPISGWTQVGVEQRGVNVWNEEWEVGGIRPQDGTLINEQRIRPKNLIPCVPNTTYYILDPTNNDNIRVFYYAKDGSYIGCTSFIIGAQTTPNNARFMRFIVATTYGTTYNHDISINNPSTDHYYHPYTGRSITINLGQTVYGGKLDVLSGELTVYPYYASYNGETLTGEWISDRDVYAVGTTPTIGAQVVNIGAQGTEYQLEPHEVASLLGINNIFADTGDTACEYRADTKLYIEKLTQPEEDDMIADANITSGQYFMVGNSLYKATANIANGASIIVGTNCIRKSLSEALNEINA